MLNNECGCRTTRSQVTGRSPDMQDEAKTKEQFMIELHEKVIMFEKHT